MHVLFDILIFWIGQTQCTQMGTWSKKQYKWIYCKKKKKEKIWSKLNEKQKSFTRHLENLKTQKI